MTLGRLKLAWVYAAALTALATVAASQSAQQPPAPPSAKPADKQEQQPARIRTRTDMVVVPVTIKSSGGNLVEDLRREEFTVLEDGVEQQLAFFSQEAVPLSVVILIDNALPNKTARQVEQSLGSIAAAMAPHDQATVMLFDEFPAPAEEFLADNDKIHERLKRMKLGDTMPGRGSGPMTAGPRINSQTVGGGVALPAGRAAKGTKNIDDAIYGAARALQDAAEGRRRIIFVISDGENSGQNAVSFEDCVKLLLSEDIIVHAVGVGEASLNRLGSALGRYTTATGGDLHYAKSRAEMEAYYPRVTEQARNQYTLGYVPRDTDRSKEYHEIEVKVRRPFLTLLARQGYFTATAP